MFSLSTVCIIMSFLLIGRTYIRYSGVNCALGLSKSIRYQFRYSGVRYSRVCFHIFYCNSAGLANVVRYRGFVIAGCHCSALESLRCLYVSPPPSFYMGQQFTSNMERPVYINSIKPVNFALDFYV